MSEHDAVSRLSRVNAWLARTPEGMRPHYDWVDNVRAIELIDKVGWFAFSSDCITCTGMELLRVIISRGKYPEIGLEFFDKDPGKVRELCDFALANTPSIVFIMATFDGGITYKVVR